MTEKRVYILTGFIQSGKTTRLIQWSAGRKDVFGILTPVINSERVFVDAHTREQFKMEAEPGEGNALAVGKFVFSKKAFEKAIEILQKAMKEKEGWLIIDELGPLELNGEGFSAIARNILKQRNIPNLILVLRESLLQRVIDHFQIEDNNLAGVTKDSGIFSE